MRKLGIIASVSASVAALTIAGSVTAQDAAPIDIAPATVWQFYETVVSDKFKPVQAYVRSSAGDQLILKCDEPGRREVYAIVVSNDRLALGGSARFENRPTKLNFNGGRTEKETWRYNDHFASAVNERGTNTLTRFLVELADADTVEFEFDPSIDSYIEVDFTVTGAREAIATVFESCDDKNPLG